MSPACRYLGVVLSTGLTLILDCLNRFSLLLKLEDHFNEHSFNLKVYKGIWFFKSYN